MIVTNIFYFRVMKIGSILKEMRIKRGWNQTKAAKKIGITQASLSLMERDEAAPPLSKLDKIAKAYGAHPVLLMWASIQPGDIPKSKRQAFIDLKASVDTFIKELL